MISPFHLALPVRDLDATRRFYIDILGCSVGRSAPRWLDVNFWGHQLSLHLDDDLDVAAQASTNSVDGDDVPTKHFGVILDWDRFEEFKIRLLEGEYADEIHWVIRPNIRFEGKVGEQATMFVRDPSGNVLEFKSFQNMECIFQS